MSETIYPKGMRLWPPSENAPDFIKGKLSIHVETFTEWAKTLVDEKGFVKLDLKEGREDKALYLALNTYKKEAKAEVDVTNEEQPF